MRLSRCILCCLVLVFALGNIPGTLKAEEFKIAVLQDDQFSAEQYEPLVEHLARTGISVRLVGVPTYEAAAGMIASGTVDAMFNGPGIPGSMIVICNLRQNRLFSHYQKEEPHVRQAMASQTRVN
jgi:hypothetical protein